MFRINFPNFSLNKKQNKMHQFPILNQNNINNDIFYNKHFDDLKHKNDAHICIFIILCLFVSLFCIRH